MKLALIFSLFLTLNLTVMGQEKGAAKVIVLKGKALALIGGKTSTLKRGDWLPVGAQVKTLERSFAKLLFIDKSTMNVGPSSQMKIDAFPKQDAGIITLVKGQIRSKVTKNYMQMNKKDKSKLFIKTKTAAMGVRGTDFQVSYSLKTQNTTLLTFEGSVAMAKLAAGASRFNQALLEKAVSGPTAVMVRRGQFSGASPKSEKTTVPVKISPIQLESLESKSAPGLQSEGPESSSTSKPKKKFRKVVPPGVDAKTVANDGSELSKSMAGAVSSTATTNSPSKTESKSTESGPKAGTIVHMETGLFISPPDDAVFDANTQTYEVPTDVAFVDPKSGELTTNNFEISSTGKWEKKKDLKADQRTPASVGSTQGEADSSSEPGEVADAPQPPKLDGPTDKPVEAPSFSVDANAPAPVRQELCSPNCFQPPDIIPGRPVNVNNNGRTKVLFNPVIQP